MSLNCISDEVSWRFRIGEDGFIYGMKSKVDGRAFGSTDGNAAPGAGNVRVVGDEMLTAVAVGTDSNQTKVERMFLP